MINGFTLHDTNTAPAASSGILAQTPLDAFMKGAEWSAPGKLKPAA